MRTYTVQDLIDKDYITDVDLASALTEGRATVEGTGGVTEDDVRRIVEGYSYAHTNLSNIDESGVNKIKQISGPNWTNE